MNFFLPYSLNQKWLFLRLFKKRIRQEINDVLQNSGGHLDLNEIRQLTYLERCIKESLRLYPSVPFISRNTREDLKLSKFTIPIAIYSN